MTSAEAGTPCLQRWREGGGTGPSCPVSGPTWFTLICFSLVETYLLNGWHLRGKSSVTVRRTHRKCVERSAGRQKAKGHEPTVFLPLAPVVEGRRWEQVGAGAAPEGQAQVAPGEGKQGLCNRPRSPAFAVGVDARAGRPLQVQGRRWRGPFCGETRLACPLCPGRWWPPPRDWFLICKWAVCGVPGPGGEGQVLKVQEFNELEVKHCRYLID